MIAKDFILESSYELQQKAGNKFWEETELIIKLQRAYKVIQKDLPCFIESEQVSIKEGISLYNLKHIAIKGINLSINNREYKEQEQEELFKNSSNERLYSLNHKELYISPIPANANNGILTYYYRKELENENDYITTPIEYEEALRLLYLSYVFEKAPKDMTQRDLSIHYLKRYEMQKDSIKSKKKKKSVNSSYQRI